MIVKCLNCGELFETNTPQRKYCSIECRTQKNNGKYIQNHKEEIKQYHKLYYEEHKEEIKTRSLAYYYKNKEVSNTNKTQKTMWNYVKNITGTKKLLIKF